MQHRVRQCAVESGYYARGGNKAFPAVIHGAPARSPGADHVGAAIRKSGRDDQSGVIPADLTTPDQSSVCDRMNAAN